MKLRNIQLKLIKNDFSVFISFLLFYAALFFSRISGAGQFWDNVFPLFSEHIRNYFLFDSQSWNSSVDFGTPLGYSPNYYFRYLISSFDFLQPEVLFYLIYVFLFTIGSFFAYLVFSKHKKDYFFILLAIICFVNPAIFYKFNAGHIDYIVSYVLLIVIIYFLKYYISKSVYSYILLGTFFALIGLQIQFFILTSIILLIYFIISPQNFSPKYSFMALSIVFFVNLVWLMNFISGAKSTIETSALASLQKFSLSSNTSYIELLTFNFSKATAISKIFSTLELLPFFIILLSTVYLSIVNKTNKNWLFYMVNFLIFVFLGTGMFNMYDIPLISIFYPMFRESGHFAPLIILFLILAFYEILPNKTYIFYPIILLAIIFSSSKFIYYSQSYNYAEVRNKFQEFVLFEPRENYGSSVLTYPFYGQYALLNVPIKKANDFNLSNTGYDSFNKYSGIQVVNNSLPPYLIKNSIQHNLITSYDLEEAAALGIKYIFDYSDIYESYYNKYVPAETYNYDLSLIKNNPTFFTKLLESNKNLTKISPRIYEIKETSPIISGFTMLYNFSSTTNATDYRDLIKVVNEDSHFYYTDTQDAVGKGVYSINQIFTENKTSATLVNSSKTTKLLSDNTDYNYRFNFENRDLSYEINRENNLFINGTSVLHNLSDVSQQKNVINLPNIQNIFFITKNWYIPLKSGVVFEINSKELEGSMLAELGENIIPNPSFENEAWSQAVYDCNDYDSHPILGMTVDTETFSDGIKSLRLEAKRHTACTNITVPVVSGEKYLFEFDYQSKVSKSIRYAIEFNNKIESTRFITKSNNWEKYSSVIEIPEGTNEATIYAYTEQSDGQTNVINYFDNYSLRKILLVKSVNVTRPDKNYFMDNIMLPSDKATFEYISSKYTLKNLISNPSFEDGLWQETVSDCNNVDDKPNIGMTASTTFNEFGSRSLQLSAQHHTACTYQIIPVTEGVYQFGFKYQSPNASSAYYLIKLSGKTETFIKEELPITTKEWQNFSSTIVVPSDTSAISVYLYARPENMQETFNRYDDIELIKIPATNNSYYILKQPEDKLIKPNQISFNIDGPTKKTVTISDASTPFYLVMNVGYHSKWQAEFDNEKSSSYLNSWSPFFKPDIISHDNHFKLNGAVNGWYIDTDTYCLKLNLCTLNNNGTYTLKLILEFTPQRWFNIGRLISITTLTACMLYLSYYLITNNLDNLRRKYKTISKK